MTTKHSALLALLAIGCFGLGTWNSQSSLAQDLKPTVVPADLGAIQDTPLVPPPVETPRAESEQTQTIGRYQLFVLPTGQGFLVDTATGQVWSRFFTDNTRKWTDQGKPDVGKEKVAVATPFAPRQRMVQERIVRRGEDGVERKVIIERPLLVGGDTAPHGFTVVRPAGGPLDQESMALVGEIIETLSAAKTKAAKERLGNDLRKTMKEAEMWNELESLPPQNIRKPSSR